MSEACTYRIKSKLREEGFADVLDYMDLADPYRLRKLGSVNRASKLTDKGTSTHCLDVVHILTYRIGWKAIRPSIIRHIVPLRAKYLQGRKEKVFQDRLRYLRQALDARQSHNIPRTAASDCEPGFLALATMPAFQTLLRDEPADAETEDIAIQLENDEDGSSPDSGSDVLATVTNFSVLLNVMRQVLEELIDVCEEQAHYTGPGARIGARAKIYGTNDVQISAGGRSASGLRPKLSVRTSSVAARGGPDAGAADEHNGYTRDEDGEVMYLGPGLAVPSGPPPRAGAGQVQTQGHGQDSPAQAVPPYPTNRIASSIRSGAATGTRL